MIKRTDIAKFFARIRDAFLGDPEPGTGYMKPKIGRHQSIQSAIYYPHDKLFSYARDEIRRLEISLPTEHEMGIAVKHVLLKGLVTASSVEYSRACTVGGNLFQTRDNHFDTFRVFCPNLTSNPNSLVLKYSAFNFMRDDYEHAKVPLAVRTMKEDFSDKVMRGFFAARGMVCFIIEVDPKLISHIETNTDAGFLMIRAKTCIIVLFDRVLPYSTLVNVVPCDVDTTILPLRLSGDDVLTSRFDVGTFRSWLKGPVDEE